MGRLAQARELFETLANTCVPEYQGCSYLAGEICHIQGDYAQAIERYALSPSEPSVLYNLALAYFQSHQLEDSAMTFIRAFAQNPHVCEALLERPLIMEPEHSMQGYLTSPMYAEEFIEACGELWQNAYDARAFMTRCYDDPQVRQQLLAQMDTHGLHEQADHLLEPPSAAQIAHMHQLAQRVLERMMY